ncbi:cyclopropane-fatty-acyl-phospholipid synthase family protein [Streptomyces sp. TS71-3]|uniref:SAM-dependent methyltransferase n=1 Tax=Streptomyces sp. TS71-3 TaxID=2733862 RepID=UPI001B1486B9|nr:cyclopropane-fatty-acyl-phospholipid synthase family protein [Streptomyces sp. TS71-3]GHJ37141.1 tuberculostearic acid methyltransferase UfaA1 [Streptomyces sp. TS71-3]
MRILSTPTPRGTPARPGAPAPHGARTRPGIPASPRTRVDASRWPDVARVPGGSPLRTGAARWLVVRALAGLPVRLELAGAPVAGQAGPLLRVHDPRAFFRRIGAHGLIGFGESYMAGEWDADDLVAVLTVLASHATSLVPRPLQRLRGAWTRRRPAAYRNTPDGARQNVHRHYDLSNELFALFLDPTMTYSSAVFPELPATWPDLAAAQQHKIDRLLDLAGVGPGTRLLEIGTGWGELALRAASRGARVRTVTLSRAQRDLAAERVRAAGHAERVEVELCDYREVTGVHDAVVSVEMIEAVGGEYWPVYFETLRRLLAPGGRIALQAITMAHERMQATRTTHTWINKYIFPGGLIPSAEAVERSARPAGLRVEADDGFGEHYAQTLRLWRERFTARGDDVTALGFDATFRRMWEFYLAYSEAGFRSGYLDVRQMLLTAAPAGSGDTR